MQNTHTDTIFYLLGLYIYEGLYITPWFPIGLYIVGKLFRFRKLAFATTVKSLYVVM